MEPAELTERVALFALLHARPGRMTWADVAAEVAYEGSAVTVWQQRVDGALLPDPGLVAAMARAEADLRDWTRAGLRLVTVLDPDYPQRLLDIRETPPFLFVAGDVRANDPGMSVVGSRHASDPGLAAAAAAARLLVDKGLAVIAGLAAGIDTAAHRAALGAGGRTVAVLGTGINHAYPAENRGLQEEIAARGLVLSQFLPDAPPTKRTFPMRNATMSGYGLATIVIEAGEMSGARIQARLATEHGRPVILTRSVVRSTRWGAALAHRPGVHVVEDADDLAAVIEKVRGEQDELKAALRDLAPAPR